MKQTEAAAPANPFTIFSDSLDDGDDGVFAGSGAGKSFAIAANFGPNIVSPKIEKAVVKPSNPHFTFDLPQNIKGLRNIPEALKFNPSRKWRLLWYECSS